MAEGSEIASEIVAMKTLTFLTGLKMFILPSLQSVFLLFAIGSVNSQSGINVEQTDLEDFKSHARLRAILVVERTIRGVLQ